MPTVSASGGQPMLPSTIEGVVSTIRHEHVYIFLEATADSTWFGCIHCHQLLQEPEDAGTGA